MNIENLILQSVIQVVGDEIEHIKPYSSSYLTRIKELVTDHYAARFHQRGGWRKEFGFYAYRIMKSYNYGLVQGREIIKMVCRCAFNDSSLTDNESIVIMETCLDPALDNILLEVNYNASW